MAFHQVVGLHGGALLGISYRSSRRVSAVAATAISTIQSMPLSGFGSGASSFNTFDDGFGSGPSSSQNFQLYRWVIKLLLGMVCCALELTLMKADSWCALCTFYNQYSLLGFKYYGSHEHLIAGQTIGTIIKWNLYCYLWNLLCFLE